MMNSMGDAIHTSRGILPKSEDCITFAHCRLLQVPPPKSSQAAILTAAQLAFGHRLNRSFTVFVFHLVQSLYVGIVRDTLNSDL